MVTHTAKTYDPKFAALPWISGSRERIMLSIFTVDFDILKIEKSWEATLQVIILVYTISSTGMMHMLWGQYSCSCAVDILNFGYIGWVKLNILKTEHYILIHDNSCTPSPVMVIDPIVLEIVTNILTLLCITRGDKFWYVSIGPSTLVLKTALKFSWSHSWKESRSPK